MIKFYHISIKIENKIIHLTKATAWIKIKTYNAHLNNKIKGEAKNEKV